MPDNQNDNILSSLQAPGAATQTTPPPDVMAALQNQQQAQVQPAQAQAASQFLGQGQGQAPQQGGGQQTFAQSQMQNLLSKIQDLAKPSASEEALQKSIAYTPQQRAEDIYNNMFGIKKVPKFDPTSPEFMMQGAPTGTSTKINWGKFIPATLAEMARGFVQKDQYVPARERAQQQALQTFNAEATPLAREAMYDQQNRRAAMRDATSLINTVMRTGVQQDLVKVKQDAEARLQDRNSELLPAQTKLAYAKAADLATKAQYEPDIMTSTALKNQAQAFFEQAETEYKKAQTTGQIQSNTVNQGLKGQDADALQAKEYYLRIGNKAAADQIQKDIDARNQKAQSSNIVIKTDANNNQVAINKGDLSKPPQIVGGSSTQGPITPQTTGGPGTIPNPNSTGTLPPGQLPPGITPPPATGVMDRKNPLYNDVSQYYQGSALMPFPTQYKDTLPPGTDPKTAAIIMSVPNKTPPTGISANRINASKNGFQDAEALRKMIGMIPDDQFGTILGNWNKFKAEHLSTADPNFVAIMNRAGILGANHSAAQSFRSAQFVDSIQKSISKFGTNKQAMLAGLDQYEGTFANTLRSHPEIKGDGGFTQNIPAEAAVRLWHPNLYKSVYGHDPEDYENSTGGPQAKGVPQGAKIVDIKTLLKK